MPGNLGELPIERTWGHTQQWPWQMDPARTAGAGGRMIYSPPTTPNPDDSEALRKALLLEREVVWWSQLAPHQAPPFRAMPLMVYSRAVLNVAAAATLGAAGAAAIGTAEGMIAAVTVFPAVAAAAGVPQQILNFTVPQNHRAVVRHWGARLGDGASEAVTFQIAAGTPNPLGEVELAAISDLEAPAPVLLLATEGQQVSVWARLIDTVAPAYVQTVIKGWIYPVLQADDSLRSSLSDSFGPQTNGRFGRMPCGPGGTT